MQAIKVDSKLQLQIILGASAVLDRFGKVEILIKKDGFSPNYVFNSIIEGETPTTMAQSTGLGMIEAAMILENLKPEFLIVVGDRFEMMSVTIAAAYMNIKIVHTMGGEVTGTIDESIRHAITKFSHVHFPANEDSRNRIIKMGENKKFVFNVGCPRIDLVADELTKKSIDYLKESKIFSKYKGVGNGIDFEKPFLLVSQHPVTTEYGSNRAQVEETLNALNKIKMQTVLLWPNIDAGSDDVSKGIRTFRENNSAEWLHAFINLPTDIYIHLMNTASCLVGNSSSGIREGAFIGTPVVNIGTRQSKRMRSDNVIDVGYKSKEILKSIQSQINHGKYSSSTIYGDGKAGKKIVEILREINPPIQKIIHY